jgi:para-nitrobenzyl esterase
MRKGLLAIAMVALSSMCMAAPPTAKVEQGLLQGTVENGLAVYRGIPFAAPPVGDRRWRPPQPAANWKGIRRADSFAPECVQRGFGPPPSGEEPPAMSEDCLYLNVWTPAKKASDRIPVLVWIYGGGFNAGATSVPTYGGEKLAQKGVVLVSIAYRVGPIGFLALPQLSAESPHHVSGNYGLLDMIAALQWIQKNIATFGGNPHKVTIFGESAGGIAVSMLCASPLAKGLFQGAISESGGSFGPVSIGGGPGENMWALADAERRGEELAKTLGATSLEELRKLPAEKILTGQRGLAWPIVDGWVIPGDQYKLYEAKRFNDTPILIGYNSDEGASFSPPHTPQEYIENVRKRYGKFADALIKAYPAGVTTVPKTARDLMRDSAFGWHTWTWARLQSQLGKSKVYFYYFDQHPDYPVDSPQAGHGAPHGRDVPYVFEQLQDDPHIKPTAADRAISEAMATYWTNFAKYGDPNSKGVPDWPAFSDQHPVLMYFQQTPHTGPVPSEKGLKVLDAYFAWRRSQEGARHADDSKPAVTKR